MLPEEREKKLSELKTELVRLRTTVESGGRLENPARVKELRRGIARILTVQNEKPETKEKEKAEGE
jgi:ribosomal protein L29